MSDVTVRWLANAEGETREECFQNVRLELLLVGQTLLGWMVKGTADRGGAYQAMIFLSRIEMLTEEFEHDPRDDDKPDTKPGRLTVVPK